MKDLERRLAVDPTSTALYIVAGVLAIITALVWVAQQI